MEMEILDAREECFAVDDPLLDFNLDVETAVFNFKGDSAAASSSIFNFKGDSAAASSSSSLESSKPATAVPFIRQPLSVPFPEFVEEELEWLSNKDAFPAVETCFGILSDNLELVLKHHSPISVLENSSNTNSNGSCCSSLKVPTNHPVRARTKRRKRRVGFGDLPSTHCLWPNRIIAKNKQESSSSLQPLRTIKNGGASMGRRCLHCQSDRTPQWRAGPMGPKTLCNACGVRYKSGRLLPEYRPANSPTFSSTLHSNSHRKVIEMRQQKQMTAGEGPAAANVACGRNSV